MSASKSKVFTAKSGKISKLSADGLKDKKKIGKDAPAAPEENTKKSKISDIDSLFDGAKEKKKAADADLAAKSKKAKKSAPQAAVEDEVRVGKVNGRIISPEAPLERIDAASGLPVYKTHLLQVGKGGGTDLCPFDCDCCF